MDLNEVLHLGGQDRDEIDAAYDHIREGRGAIGFDPYDLYVPSADDQSDVEQNLPQWGPPFVKFVDQRLSKLERAVIAAMEVWKYQSVTVVFPSSMQTDSSGNIGQAQTPNANIYTPPPGFTLALHRIIIRNTANNFGTPFTNAGSWWELRVNGEPIDGASMVSGVGSLPVVKTWGTRDAPRIRDGQVLSLFMSAGPASAAIFVLGQGTLDRTIEG